MRGSGYLPITHDVRVVELAVSCDVPSDQLAGTAEKLAKIEPQGKWLY